MSIMINLAFEHLSSSDVCTLKSLQPCNNTVLREKKNKKKEKKKKKKNANTD